MKIGIFGGSFNPIHNEHLFIANATLEKLNLNKILFIPTYNALHKDIDSSVSYSDRVKMLELALLSNKKFEISTIEYELNKNSYTYFTLIALKEKYPDNEFYFIMGNDSYKNFCSWYRWYNLLELANFVIIGREGTSSGINDLLESHFLSKKKIIKLNIKGRLLSSSAIRKKIKNNESVLGLVPIQVGKYIEKHKLYQ